VAQVVENLSSKCEALNSIPSTTKNFKNLKIKKKKKKKLLKKSSPGGVAQVVCQA
jgi:hypothetical protein